MRFLERYLAANRTNVAAVGLISWHWFWERLGALLKKKFELGRKARQAPAEDAWRQLPGKVAAVCRHTRVEIAIACLKQHRAAALASGCPVDARTATT